MKKIILGIVLTSILFMPVLALAEPVQPPGDGSIWTILNRIIGYLFGVLFFIAAIFIIIAGYLFVTAQGDAEKVKTARTMIIYALIGILVAGLSWVLVNIARNMVGA